jgi:hypothetical protein
VEVVGRIIMIGKIINIGPEKKTLYVMTPDEIVRNVFVPDDYVTLALDIIFDCGEGIPSGVVSMFHDAAQKQLEDG